MKHKLLRILAIVLVVALFMGAVGCDDPNDPWTENVYFTNLYVWNSTNWVHITGGGGGGGAGLWETDGGDAELIVPDTIDMQSQYIHNVLDPLLNQDAATKLYVDAADTVLTNDLATNVTQINTNVGNIATNAADIATNTADIATNATAITTNAANIATNVANIATNAANIASNAADIASNASRIDTNEVNIATNTADIASNVSVIVVNAANIATNAADIASNASRISTNTADIASNASAIATNTANIATNTADIASNATALATHMADPEAHHAMSGSSFPASPVDGMVFCLDITGRKILYAYDLENTTWVAIESIGSMTVYVDKTDGTDNLTQGTGVDSAAFATVQFAIDCIPGLVGGDVSISINAESYAEDVVIQGKSFTGDYSITINGTLTVLTSGTQSANGVQGSGADQGQFTDVGNLAGVTNLLCYLDADGDYRIIDWTDGNSANATGTFTSQPLQNENYIIYDWGTVIDSIEVGGGQQGVVLAYLDINYAAGTNYAFGNGCRVIGNGIRFSPATTATVRADVGAWLDFNYSIFENVRWYNNLCLAEFYRCKFLDGASGRVIILYGGKVTILQGTIVDGDGTAGIDGIECNNNSLVSCYGAAATGYNRIRNCATGLQAQTGGMIVSTANNQYSGNTVTDEDAVAASYGYID